MANKKFIQDTWQQAVLAVEGQDFAKGLALADTLKPYVDTYPDLYNLPISIYQQKQDYDRAYVICRDALEKHPNHEPLQFSMGLIMLSVKNYDEAVKHFSTAYKLNPSNLQALRKQAYAESNMERWRDAERHYKQYFTKEKDGNMYKYYPDIIIPSLHLGKEKQAYQFLKKYEDAWQNNLNLSRSACWHNMGSYYMKTHQYPKALDIFYKTLEVDKDNIEVYAGLGACHQQLGEFTEAKYNYEQALSIEPDSVNANWNFSQLQLLLSNFTDGWRRYQWRWKTDKYARFTLPWGNSIKPWQGQPLLQRSIIVHAEQGIGDEIFFNYFISRLQDYGAAIHLSCDKRLEPLFKRSLPNVTIMHDYYLKEPEYGAEHHIDYYIPLASVPWRIGAFFNGKYMLRPWLKADNDKIRQYKKYLQRNFPHKKICGISWFTRHDDPTYNPRNITLEQLLPILSAPDWVFINLQYGDDAPISIKKIKETHGIDIHIVPNVDVCDDFDSMAALLRACDRIFTIDNTTVHMAGGLGVETDLMLPLCSEWRWGRKDDIGIYPHTHVHRQQLFNEWDNVIEQVARTRYSSIA